MNGMKTGRTLQLEGLDQMKNKVTIGFKCQPTAKMKLAREADSYSMSLSEYVETIVANRNSQHDDDAQLHVEIQRLQEKVQYYERGLLRKAYKKNKGRVIAYVNVEGDEKSRTINRIEDVFAIILDTVKLD